MRNVIGYRFVTGSESPCKKNKTIVAPQILETLRDPLGLLAILREVATDYDSLSNGQT